MSDHDIHHMPVVVWPGDAPGGPKTVDMDPPIGIGEASVLHVETLSADYRGLCDIGWHEPASPLARFAVCRGGGRWDVHLICRACATKLAEGVNP